MTIFLKVLKHYIREILSPISMSLDGKSKSKLSEFSMGIFGRGYNANMSIDVKQLIDDLMDNVAGYAQGASDSKHCTDIIHLIKATLDQVTKKREDYKEPRNGGTTVPSLNNLMEHTQRFYTTLLEFNNCLPAHSESEIESEQPNSEESEEENSKVLKLIDKPYYDTPEHIIYYHAASYLADEIFNPSSDLNVDVRNEKVKNLAKRLQFLFEVIKPNHSLQEQKQRCQQILTDISSDNNKAIKREDTSTALPVGVALFSVPISLTAPKKLISAGPGRMAKEFEAASRKIENMKIKDFRPGPADDERSENNERKFSMSSE